MNKKNITNTILLIIPFAFYLFFAIYDGPIWCVDSATYLNFSGNREPLYPLLSSLFKLIFGENYYLLSIVIFQSLFLAYVTYTITRYLIKEFELRPLHGFVIEIIFLFVSILCRFASSRSAMYSNCLLTEGIAYPSFILFFKYLIDYSFYSNKKSMFLSMLLTFVMFITRKQMIFALFLLLIVVFIKTTKNKKVYKGIFNVLIVFLIVFGCSKLFDVAYMKLVCNIDGAHTSDNRFITTMIFYTADKEDANYIGEKEARDLFIQVYNKCETNGYLKEKTQNSWYGRVKHFSNNYDNIQIDTMRPMTLEYAEKQTSGNAEILVDKYNDVIIKSLLVKKLPDIFLVLIDSFFAGLMITISADKPYFVIYSIIVYLLYIVLLVLNIKKYESKKNSILGILTLISIILNVGIVSTVIFNQTRYTFYNMALFYISMLLMLYNVFVKRKEK